MIVARDLTEAVGNTPLIRLRRASEATGCEIWGKAEFMNPGASVKDRAALWIIRDAVARGALRPGGTIVEGTAGNTGIGLARGRRGDGLPHGDRHPRHPEPGEEGRDPRRRRRARRGPGGALPRPEQLRALLGTARGEARRDRAARRGLGQPVRQRRQPAGARREHGARDLGADRRPDRRLHLRGRLGRHARRGRGGAAGAEAGRQDRPRRSRRRGALQLLRSRRAEGRGIVDHRGHRPGADHRQPRGADRRHALPASPTARRCRSSSTCSSTRGSCMGASTGVNVAGAMRMARDLGPGHTIVTILCDYGTRYQSKLFNPAFLRSKDLPVPGWLERAARPARCVRGLSAGSRPAAAWSRPRCCCWSRWRRRRRRPRPRPTPSVPSNGT